MLPVWLQYAVAIASTIGIPMIFGLAVKLIFRAGALTTEVHTIKTNHLPHIEKAVEEHKAEMGRQLTEIRTMFVAHIDKKSD